MNQYVIYDMVTGAWNWYKRFWRPIPWFIILMRPCSRDDKVQELKNSFSPVFTLMCVCVCVCVVLGDSGRVVHSLDFCPALLKSLGCFYFRCVLSSQWKAVTVNLRILHCQLQRHFWRPVVIMCLEISNNMLLMLWDAPKRIFSTNSRSSGQPKSNAKTPSIPFPW